MKEIIVRTQKDFDKIKDDFNGIVYIEGGTREDGLVITARAKATLIVRQSAVIKSVYGSAVIESVSGSAVIESVSGYASVLDIRQEVKVTTYGRNIVRYFESEKSITLILSKETTKIVLPTFNATFKEYSKLYPVKKDGKKIIMYKSVHKTPNGKYVADRNAEFEYIIGETKTEKCAPKSDGSCSEGIHLSHKMWALAFGKVWSDMALLECEVDEKDIVISKDCDGKVRTAKCKVIREVPREEWYV